MNKIKVLAIIGKSGAGKDAVVRELFAAPLPYIENNCCKTVSITTRPPREKEVEGKTYYFKNNEYLTTIKPENLLGMSTFRGWTYVLDYSTLNKEKINIGIFDPVRVKKMSESDKIDLKIIEIAATDKERLIRQLNREKDPDVKEIIRRFAADNIDFETYLKDIPIIQIQNHDGEITDVLIEILNIVKNWDKSN